MYCKVFELNCIKFVLKSHLFLLKHVKSGCERDGHGILWFLNILLLTTCSVCMHARMLCVLNAERESSRKNQLLVEQRKSSFWRPCETTNNSIFIIMKKIWQTICGRCTNMETFDLHDKCRHLRTGFNSNHFGIL